MKALGYLSKNYLTPLDHGSLKKKKGEIFTQLTQIEKPCSNF